MNINVHKLKRISLVNWYLFNRDDINVNGDSIMLTGQNGSGKSTILDAIQTILAGADENKLMYNAASSDGTRSGRTIRSYALGEVAEANDGPTIAEPRSVSNTYISLSFEDRMGRHYSFGCSFYARKDKTHVDKHFFLIKGYDLSSTDYLKDEYTVLPFKEFEKRLSTLDGKPMICSNATEFRARTCELMSVAGSDGAIAPDVLFKVIKQGLTFKPHKDVTEFTRNHILPKRDIDVVRIENDYKNYQEIQQEIEMAKERLEMFNSVIGYYETYKSKMIKGTCFAWSAAESAVCAADIEHEDIKEKLADLDKNIRSKEKEKVQLEEQQDTLKKARDDALMLKSNSDISGKIKTLNLEKTNLLERIKPFKGILATARANFIALEAIKLNIIDKESIKASLSSALDMLSRETDFEHEDMTSTWPRDRNNLEYSINKALSLDTVHDSIKSIVDDLSDQNKAMVSEIESIAAIHKSLSEGKASLKPETLKMIMIFQEHGFTALPICDLAEITDDHWQKGIERFLGVWNREALLIVDSEGNAVDSASLEEALAIYRHKKKSDKELRAVKILNPEKIKSHKYPPEHGTAGSLIESDNRIVLDFLQGLLYQVKLVNTEHELRESKRAITPDGMVAANGTISGGNKILFVLFGVKARKDQAENLHARLTNLLQDQLELKRRYDTYSNVFQTLSVNLQSIKQNKDSILSSFDQCKRIDDDIEGNHKALEALNLNSDYAALNQRFEETDTLYSQHLLSISSLKESIAGDIVKKGQYEDSLPLLEAKLAQSGLYRKSLEEKEFFISDLASSTFEDLSEKHKDDYATIESEASIKAKERYSSAYRAKEEGSKKLVELLSLHDLEDKDELIQLGPLAALKRCQEYATAIEKSEITVHEEDAKQAREMMLQHFRSEIASKLKDNINNLINTFRILNQSLKDLRFNNSQFKFTHRLSEIESLREVYEYVMLPDDIDTSGGLFDDAKNHPGLKVIEEVITDGRLSEIADYRNFYSYDIITADMETGVKRNFSELLSVGSGGEQQSPFYVALGASFMNAYKLHKYGNQGVSGGAAIAIFDEAMSKMDGKNTASALKFFKSLGLQIILAAPPEASIKISPYVDKTVTVIRAGTTVFLDEHDPSPEAIALLDSDNPMVHPDLANKFIPAVKEEFGIE